MAIVKNSFWYLFAAVSVPFINILSMPYFTKFIGPAQYGELYMITTLSTFISSISVSLTSCGLSANYHKYKGNEQRAFIGSIVFLNAMVGSSIILIAILAYSTFEVLTQIHYVNSLRLYLIIWICFSSLIWALTSDIIILRGYAKIYSITSMLQLIANLASTFIVIKFTIYSNIALVVGYSLSSTIGAIIGLLILLGFCSADISLDYLKDALIGGKSSLVSSLTENARQLFERFYVVGTLGVFELGILSHAFIYSNSAMLINNSFGKSLIPTALSEGSSADPSFDLTRKVQRIIQSILGIIILSFTVLGTTLVDILTNSKFTKATPYALALLLILLLKTTFKPHTFLLLARGYGGRLAKLQTLSVIIGCVTFISLNPYYHLWAIVLGYAVETFFSRFSTYLVSIKIHSLPFSDWNAVLTILLCTALIVLKHFHHFSPINSVLLLLFSLVPLFVAEYKLLMSSLSLLYKLF